MSVKMANPNAIRTNRKIGMYVLSIGVLRCPVITRASAQGQGSANPWKPTISARTFLDAPRTRVLYSTMMIRAFLAFTLTAGALASSHVLAQTKPQGAAARTREIYVSVQGRN